MHLSFWAIVCVSLTRSNTEWEWTELQNKYMTKIKRMVTEAPILAFYNSAKEPFIECDASQNGLGAVLMPQGRPIAYTCRALTPSETRYAQIEETLAIVFSLDKFHQCVFVLRRPTSPTTNQMKHLLRNR